MTSDTTEVTDIDHLGNLVLTPVPAKVTLTPARLILTNPASSETQSSAVILDDSIDEIDKGGELVTMIADLAQNASVLAMPALDPQNIPIAAPQSPIQAESPSKNILPNNTWPFSPATPASSPKSTATLGGAHVMQMVHKILSEFMAKLEDERKNEQLRIQQQFDNLRQEHHQQQLEFQRHFYEQLLKQQQNISLQPLHSYSLQPK